MTTVATGQVLLAGNPPAGLAASFAALHDVSQGSSRHGKTLPYSSRENSLRTRRSNIPKPNNHAKLARLLPTYLPTQIREASQQMSTLDPLQIERGLAMQGEYAPLQRSRNRRESRVANAHANQQGYRSKHHRHPSIAGLAREARTASQYPPD